MTVACRTGIVFSVFLGKHGVQDMRVEGSHRKKNFSTAFPLCSVSVSPSLPSLDKKMCKTNACSCLAGHIMLNT